MSDVSGVGCFRKYRRNTEEEIPEEIPKSNFGNDGNYFGNYTFSLDKTVFFLRITSTASDAKIENIVRAKTLRRDFLARFSFDVAQMFVKFIRGKRDEVIYVKFSYFPTFRMNFQLTFFTVLFYKLFVELISNFIEFCSFNFRVAKIEIIFEFLFEFFLVSIGK